MGQYYKTAKPTFVDDVIYQAPYELIARALQNKDLQAEKDEAEIDEFDVLGDNKKYTEKDKAKRNELINSYRDEAESIAQDISENPQNRAYYMRKINSARKKFDKDLKTGFLNDADLNFAAREKTREILQKRTDIDDEQKATALKQLDFQFKGSDAEEGNTYSDNLHVYEALDEEKFIQAKKAELTADSITTKENRTDGRYFTDESGTRKFISDERLEKSFEGSTGVGKWEKALLQKLDWQVQQGDIGGQQALAIYEAERKAFKEDFISSLGFEQTTTTDFQTRDSTYAADQANAIAWTKLNREDNLATQDTQVELHKVTTTNKPVQQQTTTEKRNNTYNEEGQRLAKDLGDNYNAIENSLQGDAESIKLATNQLVDDGYSPQEIINLKGFVANKKRVYKAVDSKEQAKGYKAILNSTPDTAYVSVKYTKNGVDVIEEMPLHEARVLSQGTKQEKVTTEVPETTVYNGETVVAYKAPSGKKVPLTRADGSTVSPEDYDEDADYKGRTASTKKRTALKEISLPFSTANATVTTGRMNYKYDNYLANPTSTEVVNYHQLIKGREVIISIPIDTNKANILNK